MVKPAEVLLFYFQLRDKVESLYKELEDDTLRPDVRVRKQDYIDMYLSMMEEANYEYFKKSTQLN